MLGILSDFIKSSKFGVVAIAAASVLLSACGSTEGNVNGRRQMPSGPSLKVSGDPTLVEINEGATVVILPMLTATRTASTVVAISISSARNDVADVFNQALPIATSIPAGQTSVSVGISTILEPDYSGDRDFTVTLSSPSTAGTFSFTLRVKDLQTQPVLSFASATRNLSEGAGAFTTTVNLSGPSIHSVGVAYSFTDGTAGASDYAGTASTLTFAAGETSKTISASITEDVASESTENFSIDLGAVTGLATVNAAADTHTVSIIDNEAPTLSISDVTVAEGGNATFTVNLSPASGSAVTVDYATSNGTASAGTHYTTTSGQLNFIAGQTSKTILVPTTAIGAEICAANRNFTLTLSNESGAALGVSAATGTITDPDLPTIAIANGSGTEGGDVSFTVSLSAACATKIVGFNWATSSGTATSATDFGAVSSSASIAAGATTTSLVVSSINDSVYEGSEGFSVTLTSATNGTFSDASGAGTLNDDELQPTVQFSAASQSASESAGTATITATLSHASASAVSVPFTLTGTATLGAGSDYTITASPVSFSANDTSETVTVTINDDSVHELDETVIATIGAPTGATASGNTVHTLTITNDEAVTITNVTSAKANGAYSSGTVDIDVTFSASVDVTGTPALALNTTPARSATYHAGTNSNTLTFRYTIVSGDVSADLDYLATTSLTLEGGTIKDDNLDNATLTLPAAGTAGSLGDNRDIEIEPPAAGPSDFELGVVSFSSITSSGFDAAIGFSGDADASATVTMWYCSHTSSANCNPLAGASAAMTRGAGYYTVTVSGLVAAENHTYNVIFAGDDSGDASQVASMVSLRTNAITSISGVVKAVEKAGGVRLLAGSFSSIQPTSPYAVRMGPTGTFDQSFYSALTSEIYAVAQQPNGKLLVGGKNGLQRLNTDGSNDATFTNYPVAAFPWSAFNWVKAITLLSDGKILICGAFPGGVLKLNADGTLDATFEFDYLYYDSWPSYYDAQINDLQVQADGKIIVAGSFNSWSNTSGGLGNVEGLARYNADGTIDPAFTAGAVFGASTPTAFVIQADGKYVVGTTTGLMRLKADLTSDGSLNVNGWVESMIELPDDKIMIAGSFTQVGAVARNRIARLNVDGTLDAAFAPGAGFDSGSVYKINLASNDKILAAGSFTSYAGYTARVIRINSDGTRDTAFVPPALNTTTRVGAELQDGKVFAGGLFTTFPNGTSYRGIAAINSDYSLNTSVDYTTGTNSAVTDMLMQSDGKVVLIGSFTSYKAATGLGGIVRINTDGTIDSAFQTGSGTGFAGGAVTKMDIQADGKIIVIGAFTSYNGTACVKVVRLNTDGSFQSCGPNPLGSTPRTVKVLADGKILLGGSGYSGTYGSNVVRYTSAWAVSAPHPAFGAVIAHSIIQQTDGKILVGGNQGFNGRLFRYNLDGTADGSFTYGSSLGGTIYSLSQQSDLQILVCGTNSCRRLNTDGSADNTLGNQSASSSAFIQQFSDGKVGFGPTYREVGP